jgi:hypothetical protein
MSSRTMEIDEASQYESSNGVDCGRVGSKNDDEPVSLEAEVEKKDALIFGSHESTMPAITTRDLSSIPKDNINLSIIQFRLPNLMGRGRRFLLFLLKPVLLWHGGAALGGLTLHLDGLALVRLQVLGDVGLLGRRRGLGEGERLYVALGVVGLEWRRLVGLELLEVHVLHQVG